MRGAGCRELEGVLAPSTLAACGVGVPGWQFDAAAYAATCSALEQCARVPASAPNPEP